MREKKILREGENWEERRRERRKYWEKERDEKKEKERFEKREERREMKRELRDEMRRESRKMRDEKWDGELQLVQVYWFGCEWRWEDIRHQLCTRNSINWVLTTHNHVDSVTEWDYRDLGLFTITYYIYIVKTMLTIYWQLLIVGQRSTETIVHYNSINAKIKISIYDYVVAFSICYSSAIAFLL
jgi:hypothetical protein